MKCADISRLYVQTGFTRDIRPVIFYKACPVRPVYLEFFAESTCSRAQGLVRAATGYSSKQFGPYRRLLSVLVEVFAPAKWHALTAEQKPAPSLTIRTAATGAEG